MAQKRAKLLMCSSLPRLGEAILLALLNPKSVTIHARGSRSEIILWAWGKASAISRLERPDDFSAEQHQLCQAVLKGQVNVGELDGVFPWHLIPINDKRASVDRSDQLV
jgi:hypothetical protein